MRCNKRSSAFLSVVAIGLCFLMQSCYSPRYVYSPAAPLIPAITKKGQVSFTAGYSTNVGGDRSKNENNKKTSTRSTGLDLQAAVALNKHWMVIGSFNYRSEQNHGNTIYNNSDSMIVRYKRNELMMGSGYYHTFGGDSSLTLHILAGYGFGRSSFTDRGRMQGDDNWDRYFKFRPGRYFIQPGIVKNTERFRMQGGLVSRLSMVKFRKVQTNYTESERNIFYINGLQNRTYFFWEPGTNIRWQVNKKLPMYLEAFAGISVLLDKSFIDYRSHVVGVGITYKLK